MIPLDRRHVSALLTALLLLAAGTASARSVDERATSLGAQLRGCSLAAVGTLEPASLPTDETGRALRLRIESVLKGSSGLPDAIVRVPETSPLPVERRVLVFLVRVPESDEGAYRLGLGPLSIHPLPTVGEASALLDLARRQVRLLADGGPEPDDVPVYRALLLDAAVGEDRLAGWSATLDLASEPGLAAGLSAPGAASLLRRFETLPPHDVRRRWIVTALGRSGARETARPLTDALAGADGRALRPALAEALRALDDDEAATRLLGLRRDGDARRRADAASVLGRWGRSSFRGPLEAMLSDGDAAVREETLRALGRMSVAASFEALREALEEAKSFEERRLGLWALGRLDVPEAFALIRSVARDDPDDRLRRAAERVLRDPRAADFLE